MEYQEFEGKTTEEAIEQACTHFQVPAEELDIEIVTLGSSGIFGLGSRKAKIRAARREELEPSLLLMAQETLEKLLQWMHEPAKVTAFLEDDRITLGIETDDAGLLIGKQGQTLEALQYLVTKILAKQTRKKVRVLLDVESYRARHNESLAHMAMKNGEKAKRSGKPVTLNPMNPHDRRIVHMALQDDKELKTMSRGEGLYKKVIIFPVKKKEGPEESSGLA